MRIVLVVSTALLAIVLPAGCLLPPATVPKALPLETRSDGAIRLTMPPGSASDQNPASSPDGTRLVFTRFASGYNEGPAGLFLLNLNNGQITRLTPRDLEQELGEEPLLLLDALVWGTFLGGSLTDPRVLSRARQASPLTYVDVNDPPFLIIHGEAGGMVPIDQSEQLAAAWEDVGGEVTFIPLPGAGHSYHPTTTWVCPKIVGGKPIDRSQPRHRRRGGRPRIWHEYTNIPSPASRQIRVFVFPIRGWHLSA